MARPLGARSEDVKLAAMSQTHADEHGQFHFATGVMATSVSHVNTISSHCAKFALLCVPLAVARP